MSGGNAARRVRTAPVHWVGVCFQCADGTPPNWHRFLPHEVSSPVDSARTWMTGHACTAGHSDVLIVCGRLDNGGPMHALPPMLLDEVQRRLVVDGAAVHERWVSRQGRLRGRENITVLLPTGHVIETVSSVMDAVAAYAALTARDLGD